MEKKILGVSVSLVIKKLCFPTCICFFCSQIYLINKFIMFNIYINIISWISVYWVYCLVIYLTVICNKNENVNMFYNIRSLSTIYMKFRFRIRFMFAGVGEIWIIKKTLNCLEMKNLVRIVEKITNYKTWKANTSKNYNGYYKVRVPDPWSLNSSGWIKIWINH